MTPVASTTTAEYKPVFGVVRIPFWVMMLSLGAVGMALLYGLGTVMADRSPVIGIAVFVVSLLQAFIILPIYQRQSTTLYARVSANIQQKYGATVGDPAVPTSSVGLTGPYSYTLVFPDGTRSEYKMRFDPNTSEPFMVTVPTPDQLEQNAMK